MVEVVISNQAEKGMQHEVSAGAHRWIADVGEELGGKATGPDPHEMLLAALGSCTSMTMKLFSQRRGWKIDEIRIKLREESVNDPAAAGKKMTRITREILVKGDLTQEQRDTLKSIADKCPIHKILVDSKEIVTQLEAMA